MQGEYHSTCIVAVAVWFSSHCTEGLRDGAVEGQSCMSNVQFCRTYSVPELNASLAGFGPFNNLFWMPSKNGIVTRSFATCLGFYLLCTSMYTHLRCLSHSIYFTDFLPTRFLGRKIVTLKLDLAIFWVMQ